jgi:glucose-fructose oxidoreductase
MRVLSRRYGVPAFGYDEVDTLFHSGQIDAVYVALPNSMHADCVIRAATAGLHVLCEKPMAVTEDECERMLEVSREAGIKLMIAYRLHFDRANLSAIDIVRKGKIGEPRFITAEFCMPVKDGDIRLDAGLGGGPLYDIGVYCINAARYLFGDEPEEVIAQSARMGGDRRFRDVDEMTAAILRFPGDRLATFTCSFGASDADTYHVFGSKGDLRVEPAFGYTDELAYVLTVGSRKTRRRFAARDQFGAELLYFSNCVHENREPEPSGVEGLADVRVVRALLESAKDGKPVALRRKQRDQRPTLRQEIQRPPVRTPPMVHVESPRLE